MAENNLISSSNTIETEIEKLEISDLGMTWAVKAKGRKRNALEPSESSKDPVVDTGFPDFKIHSNIERKLTELQCPFTWLLPRAGIIPSEKILSLTEKDKELEEDEFKIRNFMSDLLIMYELCNDDKVEEANKKLISLMARLKDFYSGCEDEYFANMKTPLQHVMLSCKAHIWKAYISKLAVPKEQALLKIYEILKIVHPYSEMTESEQAAMYGLKAQAFSEYGYTGYVEALEFVKKAIELDPKESEWYFQTGKLMGRIRRCANWNEIVKKEEIKLLEQAVDLCEKPLYLVFLATSYVDCVKSICRNIQLDDEMKTKINDMNIRAKELYMKTIQLKPDCAHLNIRCASGLLKMPRSLIDKNVIKNCIKVALEKAPNNGFVNHVAGMFAERHEHDFDKALHYYKISSDLSVYGAMADYIRVKYMCDKDYDLIGALENMLECSGSSPNRHKTLSYIGSYYLFLQRDLFKALHYYSRIMEEDSGSYAISANKPVFLNIRAPINMYEILCTEVYLKLDENVLTEKEMSIVKGFLNKLNQIDPSISEKFAHKPSQIEKIMVESINSYEKYSISRGRGRGRGQGRVQNLRRQIH